MSDTSVCLGSWEEQYADARDRADYMRMFEIIIALLLSPEDGSAYERAIHWYTFNFPKDMFVYASDLEEGQVVYSVPNHENYLVPVTVEKVEEKNVWIKYPDGYHTRVDCERNYLVGEEVFISGLRVKTIPKSMEAEHDVIDFSRQALKDNGFSAFLDGEDNHFRDGEDEDEDYNF